MFFSFLGQVILDATNLNFDIEQSHLLKGRTDTEEVTGYLVFSMKMKFIELNRSFSAGQIFFEKSKSARVSYIDQYRSLHRHIFKNMQTIFNEISDKSDFSWLADYCIANNYSESDFRLHYFNDILLDLILKQFSNKYVICESQKQMVHLECFYDNFIDYFIENLVNVVNNETEKSLQVNFDSNMKILKFISYLISSIDKSCSPNRATKNNQTKSLNSLIINSDLLVPYSSSSKSLEFNLMENKHFWKKTCMIVNKLAYFLSDYYRFYSILLEKTQDNLSISNELEEVVTFFKITSDFIHKHLEPRMMNLNEKEIKDLFDTSKLNEKFLNVNEEIFLHSLYSTQNQFETLQKCIEISIGNQFNRLFELSKNLNDENEDTESKWFQTNSLGITRSQDGSILPILNSTHTDKLFVNEIGNDLQRLLNILLNILPKEIEIHSNLFANAFLSNYTNFKNKSVFEKIISRLFLKFLLVKVFKIKNDTCTILTLRSSDVKLHLNLFLSIKQFLADSLLNNHTILELISFTFLDKDITQFQLKCQSLNEFFQPFLLEYIRIQEDQFIKYISKLTDADKITEITMEVANLLSRRVSIIQINKGIFLGISLK